MDIFILFGYSLKIIVFYIQTLIETQNGTHLHLEKCLNINKILKEDFKQVNCLGKNHSGPKPSLYN